MANIDLPITFPLALSGDGSVFAIVLNSPIPDTNGQTKIGATTGGVPTSTPIAFTNDLALSDDGSILGT